MEPELRKIEGIIFDFDGTIVVSEHIHMRAWEDLANSIGKSLPPNFLRDSVGIADAELVSILFQAWSGLIDKEQIQNQKRKYYMARCGTECEPVPGVLHFIENLHRKNWPISLATSSSREEVVPVLDFLNIKKCFKSIWTFEDVKHAKPDPEIYCQAAKSIGFLTNQCLVFEDSKVGAASARAAGCILVTVQTIYNEHELAPAWFSIKDFTDSNLLSKFN